MLKVDQIRQRRRQRESAERYRAFEEMVRQSKEDQKEFDRQIAEYERRSAEIQFVTKYACSMPISIFTTKADTDAHFERVERLRNEYGLSTPAKPKLRSVS